MFTLLLGSGDSSLNSRILMLVSGFQDIRNNPFFGEFAGQVKEFGYISYYIHNFLSYWRQFGIVVFSILMFLIVSVVKYNIKILRNKSRKIELNNKEIYVMNMTLLIITSILLSRSFNYPYIFLLLGVYSNVSE
jgi:O-antigen ligase